MDAVMPINVGRIVQRGLKVANALVGGHTVTLARTTPGTYNPATGTRSSSTSRSSVVTGVFWPTKPTAADTAEGAARMRERSRDGIFAADDLPSGFVPQTGDTIGLIEGVTWTIRSASPLAPDGARTVTYSIRMER